MSSYYFDFFLTLQDSGCLLLIFLNEDYKPVGDFHTGETLVVGAPVSLDSHPELEPLPQVDGRTS